MTVRAIPRCSLDGCKNGSTHQIVVGPVARFSCLAHRGRVEELIGTPAVLAAGQHYNTNAKIVAALAKLGHLRADDRVFDPTLGSHSGWWKEWRPESLTTGTDRDGSTFDFRAVPYPDESFDVVAFDPPYSCKGGRETSGLKDMDERFGMDTVSASYEGLQAVNYAGLAECVRVLAPPRRVRSNGKWRDAGGLILLKAANFIWSSTFIPAAFDILEEARTKHDLQLIQCMELVRKHTIQPPRSRKDGYPSVQENARNNVSYLFVLRRPERIEQLFDVDHETVYD